MFEENNNKINMLMGTKIKKEIKTIGQVFCKEK